MDKEWITQQWLKGMETTSAAVFIDHCAANGDDLVDALELALQMYVAANSPPPEQMPKIAKSDDLPF